MGWRKPWSNVSAQQTGNRVQGLRVELRGGRLTILGHVAAYRIKQLAIRALLEVVSIRSPLDIQIRVGEAIDAKRTSR